MMSCGYLRNRLYILDKHPVQPQKGICISILAYRREQERTSLFSEDLGMFCLAGLLVDAFKL